MRKRKKRSASVSRARRVVRKSARTSRIWRRRFLIGVLVLLCLPVFTRVWVHLAVRGRIYNDIHKIPACKVALVLGARVRPNGTLSNSLVSRVDKAIALYKAGKVKKLLMSGDNRFVNYNEPERMKEYAVKRGVPPEDIVSDYAGRRTYDSVYRARHIFGRRRMIVVTQSFHIDRAIFLCEHLGVDAYGLSSSNVGDIRATIREIPACLGAMVDVYLRHPHPVMGKKERL